MKQLLKWGAVAFGFGIFCTSMFLIGQVSTYSTQAALPAVSAGGTVNFLSNMPQWLVFNADSAGTRTYVPVGSSLGSLFVATDQTTTSTAAGGVDLTTADTITITLPATATVDINYHANSYGSATDVCYNLVYIDGVEVDDGNQAITVNTSVNPGESGAFWRAASLSGASPGTTHTIDIKHKTSSGNTCHWRDRKLSANVSP